MRISIHKIVCLEVRDYEDEVVQWGDGTKGRCERKTGVRWVRAWNQ